MAGRKMKLEPEIDKQKQAIDEKIAYLETELKRLKIRKKHLRPKFRRPAVPITRTDFNKLVAKCSNRCPTGLRNAALLSIGFYGGLKISEALALKQEDIDFEGGQIHVLHGVNGRRRGVFFPIEHFGYIRKWLDMKEKMGIKKNTPIFCTTFGRKYNYNHLFERKIKGHNTITESMSKFDGVAGKMIQTSYVRALMPRLARKAGIKKRVSFHGLRHGCMLEYRKKGIDISNIQVMLGHREAATTMNCVAKVYPKNLKNACERVW